jgi:2,3-bisphosphoglycerate-independent phosphoglycerate mutase
LLDVPFIVVNAKTSGRPLHLRNGRLADVSPTLLDLVGIPQPPQMTGQSLVVHESAATGAAR